MSTAEQRIAEMQRHGVTITAADRTAALALCNDLLAAAARHGVSYDDFAAVASLPSACIDIVLSLRERRPVSTSGAVARIRAAAATTRNAEDQVVAQNMELARFKQIMSGERAPTSLDFALLSIAFQVSVDWLITGKEPVRIGLIRGGSGDR